MLFLGTEKYPDEDSFSKFLSANGGINNAFTDSEVSTIRFYMTCIVVSIGLHTHLCLFEMLLFSVRWFNVSLLNLYCCGIFVVWSYIFVCNIV